MEDPDVPMDTGSFNSSEGDIKIADAVIDESHDVAIVKNGSKFCLFVARTTYKSYVHFNNYVISI